MKLLFVSLEEIIARNPALGKDRPQSGTFDGAMIGHGQRGVCPIGILTKHGNVIFLPNQTKPKTLERLDHLSLRRVNGELRH